MATALVVGLLTLFSMTKIWHEVFWKEAPEVAFEPEERLLPWSGVSAPGASPPGAGLPGVGLTGASLPGARAPARPGTIAMLAPIVGLATITVLLGLLAEPALRLTARAAAQLADPASYVRAVLGDAP